MDNRKTRFYVTYAIIFVVLLGIVGITATYAFINVSATSSFGSPTVSSSIECIDLTYSETGVINLTNQFPLSDTKGSTTTPVSVTVKNSCKNAVTYSLVITSLTNSSANYMNDNQVKIKVDKGSSSLIPAKMLNTLTTVASNTNIYTFLSQDLASRTNVKAYTPRSYYYIASDASIASNGTDTYSVRLWIDYNEGGGSNANNSTEGKSFAAAISTVVA